MKPASKSTAVIVIASIVWIATVFAIYYGIALLMGDAALDPPGWDCSNVEIDGRTGNRSGDCVPQPGWHFEEYNGGRIAVRNITHTQRDRQLDIATAEHWRDLTNAQRQQILDRRATIWDFVKHGIAN